MFVNFHDVNIPMMAVSMWSHCKQSREEMGTFGSYELVWVGTSSFVTPTASGPPSTCLTLCGASLPPHAPVSALIFLRCIPSIPCLCLYVLTLGPLLLFSLVLPQITAGIVRSLSSTVYWNVTLESPPKIATPPQAHPKKFPNLHILHFSFVFINTYIFTSFSSR